MEQFSSLRFQKNLRFWVAGIPPPPPPPEETVDIVDVEVAKLDIVPRLTCHGLYPIKHY